MQKSKNLSKMLQLDIKKQLLQNKAYFPCNSCWEEYEALLTLYSSSFFFIATDLNTHFLKDSHVWSNGCSNRQKSNTILTVLGWSW